MSSSGITPSNSGPLTIRTYLGNSNNNTYLLGNYDYPVSSNRILITSTAGLLVPSDNITVSSISISSITADNAIISTSYLSTVFSINSNINFENQVNINTNPLGGVSLLVNGSTIFTEPGAQSTSQNATVTIWGLPVAAPVEEKIETTTTYTITSSISSINFQLIGAGGNSTFSNPLTQADQPGFGAYISGRLLVKQNDKLQFTIGQQGNALSGSEGTSLVYFSSIGGGNFVSSLVCIAGAGGGNGYVPNNISSSSGGGHGGGANGSIKVSNIDFIANGTQGYDGLSTINGTLVSDTDGGQGGQTSNGGAGGAGNPAGAPNDGLPGSTINTTNLIATGGLVLGNQGGINSHQGGWGGGGYSGGGGGGASATTSAGGGGGSTYIAISTLSEILSGVVCLGGQFFADNNSGSAFGGGFGSPNNPGYAEFDGYAPNATLYTNGDIECRVLKYTTLDPPIDAIGGSSALWAKYPAIATLHLNENRITECGGIEVDSGGILVDAGGIDVTGDSIFRNNLCASTLCTSTLSMTNGQIQGVSSISGTNIIMNGNTSTLGNVALVGSTFHFTPQDPSYFDSFKIEMNGSNYLTYKSTVNGENATIIQNTGGGQLVLATNTPVITINGQGANGNNNVGIATSTPGFPLDILGSTLQISSINGGIIRLNADGDNGNFIRYGGAGPNANNLRFIGSGDIEQMRINPSGNVGIGISTPQSKLDVNGSVYISSGLTLAGNISYGALQLRGGNTQAIFIQDGAATNPDQFSGYQLGITSVGITTSTFVLTRVDQGTQSPTKSIYFTQPGNVGLGISSPQYKLDVNGGINVYDYSVFNSTLCASTLCTSTLSMTNGQIRGVSSISGTNIILNGQVSTLQSLTVVSGGINATGNSIFNNVLCASTLCTSTLSMTNGQIQGVSSISGTTIYLNGNTSTIGNGTITGNFTTNGTANINGTLTTNTLSMTSGAISGVNTINGSAYPPAAPLNTLLFQSTFNTLSTTLSFTQTYTLSNLINNPAITGLVFLTIEGQAGGGSGGGGRGDPSNSSGGGGGAAGWSMSNNIVTNTTTQITITVGGGGIVYGPGADGAPGIPTSIQFNDGTKSLVCYSGGGGKVSNTFGDGSNGGIGAFGGGAGGGDLGATAGISGISYAWPALSPESINFPQGESGGGSAFFGGASGGGGRGGGGGGSSNYAFGGFGGNVNVAGTPGTLGSGGGGGGGGGVGGPAYISGGVGGDGFLILKIFSY
jgi:hypothetical protein